MSYYLRHTGKNIWHGKFSLFEESGKLRCAVSTRQGGVSKEPYNSLNLAFHVGDDAQNVIENRRLFAWSLDVDAKKIVSPEQVHGDNVVRVTKSHAGRGAVDYESAIKATDALITNEINLPIMLCFADCVPVLFFDEEHGAIGIAHAGREGTKLHIVQKTLRAMMTKFGTEPAKCMAAVAPSIGGCCYEVSEDAARGFDEGCIIRRDGKIYLDLPKENFRQLVELGVKKEFIEQANVCTADENNWYFSYRADNRTTGRIAVLMMLNGE